jgi:hypothetical protein
MNSFFLLSGFVPQGRQTFTSLLMSFVDSFLQNPHTPVASDGAESAQFPQKTSPLLNGANFSPHCQHSESPTFCATSHLTEFSTRHTSQYFAFALRATADCPHISQLMVLSVLAMPSILANSRPLRIQNRSTCMYEPL